MGEIIDAAAADAPELVIAAQQGAKPGQPAHVPLADKAGVVTGLAQQRRHGRVRGFEAQFAIAERFFQPHAHAVLIAPGDQADACGRTDSRVGIAMQELHALRREAIEHRRLVFTPTVAGEVSKAEVVGHDKEEIGLARWIAGGALRTTRQDHCQCCRSQCATYGSASRPTGSLVRLVHLCLP